MGAGMVSYWASSCTSSWASSYTVVTYGHEDPRVMNARLVGAPVAAIRVHA